MLRVTLRHYHDFGPDRSVVGAELGTARAWDALRTRTTGAFAMPTTRAELERSARERLDLAERARVLDTLLDQTYTAAVASYGVGAAILEWWLHTLRPDRPLIVTDYGPATVARLKEVFPEGHARRHDLRVDGPIEADAHIFHRIDTELGNREWRSVFSRFAAERIIMPVSDVLDARRVLTELRHRPAFKRRPASRAGYLRSRASFEALWRSTHHAEPLRVHDLSAWALTPKMPVPQTGPGASQR